MTRVVLRGQRQPRSLGRIIENTDPRAALKAALEHNVAGLEFPILEVIEGEISFLDGDTHHWPARPPAGELTAFAAAVYPPADVYWPTHGGGLRLGFVGDDYEDAALAAAFSIPRDFTIEIKQDSRHPSGSHPKYPGAAAGPVTWIENPRGGGFNWALIGTPDASEVDAALAQLGLERGHHYDHHHCPIEGQSASDAKGCVFVGDNGVTCHRCRSKGIAFEGLKSPGFVPFSSLCQDGVTGSTIVKLARHLVHWAHASAHLQDAHPNLSGNILRATYGHVLKAVHSEQDPRVAMVFNPDLRFVLSASGPLDSSTFQLLKLTDDSYDAMPCIFRVAVGTDKETGGPKLQLRRPARDRLRNGLLPDGYKAVRVIRGIRFKDDPNTIPITVPPKAGGPIRLLSGAELMAEDEAFAKLAAAFPGVDRRYLIGALAAAICAEHGGRRPIIVAVGPTGSGKGETLRLACSLIGDQRVDLTVKQEEPMNRQIGAAIAEGHRILFFDELLRR